MSRRTRKQKINAQQTNTITWAPTNSSASTSKSVNRELNITNKTNHSKTVIDNNTSSTVKDEHIGTIKKDIYKTLIITLFILGIELVLYWAL